MTDDRLGEIKALRKRIVNAQEKGEDVGSLSRELARVRAEVAAEAEVQELAKVADKRHALRGKAEAVLAKVHEQGEAIDAFLKARDPLVEALSPLLEPMRELAQLSNPSWERNPGQCYLFNDVGSFAGALHDIPRELLPSDVACPTLEMTQPSERSFGKALQAAAHLEYCLGILVSFRKGAMTVNLRPTDRGLLLDGEPETSEVELACLVCQHEKAEAINKALQDGRPLRELEAEYGVSRSTLSRHKNRCLSLGAARMVTES